MCTFCAEPKCTSEETCVWVCKTCGCRLPGALGMGIPCSCEGATKKAAKVMRDEFRSRTIEDITSDPRAAAILTKVLTLAEDAHKESNDSTHVIAFISVRLSLEDMSELQHLEEMFGREKSRMLVRNLITCGGMLSNLTRGEAVS